MGIGGTPAQTEAMPDYIGEIGDYDEPIEWVHLLACEIV